MTANHVPPEAEKPTPEEPDMTAPQKAGRNEQAVSEPAETVSLEVARFPKGFWKRVDYLLHHPGETIESLRRDADLWQLSRIFLSISLVTSALYGAVMGATNLLQGSAMAMAPKFAMILITAIKVPMLFLLTLAIVLPAVYVSNAFVGPRLSFRQMLALLLATVAMTGTVLASITTVAFFFSLTSGGYHFIKLLHVLFFICGGLAGLSFFVKCVTTVAPPSAHRTSGWLFVAWLLLYMFVGTQLAWVVRPFVGTPGAKFQVFRPRKGNFYESVIESLGQVTRTEEHLRDNGQGYERENQGPSEDLSH